MHTALEAVVEHALTTATSEDLRLDDDRVLALRVCKAFSRVRVSLTRWHSRNCFNAATASSFVFAGMPLGVGIPYFAVSATSHNLLNHAHRVQELNRLVFMDGQEALLRGLAGSGSGLEVPSASPNIILAAVTRTLRSGRRATRREESIVEREVGNVRSLEMADALSGLRDRRSPDRPGRPRSLQAIQFFLAGAPAADAVNTRARAFLSLSRATTTEDPLGAPPSCLSPPRWAVLWQRDVLALSSGRSVWWTVRN